MFFPFLPMPLEKSKNEISLRAKEQLTNTKELILNLKSLAFDELEDVEKRFQ